MLTLLRRIFFRKKTEHRYLTWYDEWEQGVQEKVFQFEKNLNIRKLNET